MRIIPTFLSFCLLFFAFSCAKEEGKVPDGQGGAPDTIEALMEESPDGDDTRMSLSGGTKLVWEEGDQITVVGSSATTFSLTEGAGKTTAKFSGSFSAAGEEPYYALIPLDNDATRTDDAVTFAIPQNKAATTGNIARYTNPIAGEIIDGSVSFKNLFGLLKLTVTLKEGSSDVNIKKITLHDLGGNMLWGTCTIPIQEGTLAYSQISLSGGDNTISMTWSGYTTLSASSSKSIYFPVPPGSLDRGFSVVFYDETGKAWTFIQKISSPVAAVRSQIIVIDAATLSEKSEPIDVKARGYYKTLFVDGSKGLNHHVSLDSLPWISACGLENDYEYVSCVNDSNRDTTSNFGILVQAPANNSYSDVTWNDENGVLLYPDGEPRFRAVFVNGGSSKKHGRYLTQDGRDHFHDFYYNGGSYIAVCAGTFLATKWVDGTNCYNNPDETTNYSFGIWPGELYHTQIPVDSDEYGSVYTAMRADAAFGDFAAGDTIEVIRHHGGSYLPNTTYNSTRSPQPERFFVYRYTEDKAAENDCNYYTYYNLMHYENLGAKKTKKDSTSIWAYKNSSSTGRAVLCGSHPEQIASGKQLTLMKNMVEYALAESGDASVKASLELGVTRQMNADWSAGTPAYAKIGDRQYHHFVLEAPTDLEDFTLTLGSGYNSSSGVDLYLSLRNGDFAWISDADYVLCNKGGQKTLSIKTLPAGTWYIGVYCATTVTATAADGYSTKYTHFFKYSGKTVTQDGIAYTLTASAVGSTASSLPDYSGEQITFNTNALDD